MSDLSWSEIVGQVAERAGERCEYCRMHQALQGATFQFEHIRPKAHGGTSNLDNLAWCCPGCNLRKSDRTDAPDPDDGSLVSLFHPRHDSWPEHFAWNGERIVGKTPTGRATVAALNLSQSRRLTIRQAERIFGWFPPSD